MKLFERCKKAKSSFVIYDLKFDLILDLGLLRNEPVTSFSPFQLTRFLSVFKKGMMLNAFRENHPSNTLTIFRLHLLRSIE